MRFGCGRPIKTANHGRKKKITVSLRCLPVISEFEAWQVTESYNGVEAAYIKGRYVNEYYIIDYLVKYLSKYSKHSERSSLLGNSDCLPKMIMALETISPIIQIKVTYCMLKHEWPIREGNTATVYHKQYLIKLAFMGILCINQTFIFQQIRQNCVYNIIPCFQWHCKIYWW